MKIFYLFLPILFFSSHIFAQNEVKGVIIDLQTQELLPFVHIVNLSKKKGVISDELGAFKISNLDAGDTLSFSSISYEKKNFIVRTNSFDTHNRKDFGFIDNLRLYSPRF